LAARWAASSRIRGSSAGCAGDHSRTAHRLADGRRAFYRTRTHRRQLHALNRL
jgi:hypothetical protein